MASLRISLAHLAHLWSERVRVPLRLSDWRSYRVGLTFLESTSTWNASCSPICPSCGTRSVLSLALPGDVLAASTWKAWRAAWNKDR